MTVLFVTDERFLAHDAGRWHPERPSRLAAVAAAIESLGLGSDIAPVAPRSATSSELHRVHRPAMVDLVAELCAGGGGELDPDTVVVPASFEAACLAAGAGLTAVELLSAGGADAAFCAVRPPGHHATPARSMGFCLLNNVAVTAACLAEAGERVMILDWDAHHGNGTQDAFYRDDRVLFVSLHQFPFYPGTGALEETGEGAGAGLTVNVPLPAGTPGDTYRAAFDEIVTPLAERFRPTWLLISAGFDAHRDDPLTQMGLTSGDYADLTVAARRFVPPGRVVAFLEGGYDLDALGRSVGACVAALAGAESRPEPASSGSAGRIVVERVRARHGLV